MHKQLMSAYPKDMIVIKPKMYVFNSHRLMDTSWPETQKLWDYFVSFELWESSISFKLCYT